MNCPTCGGSNPQNATTCATCGAPMSQHAATVATLAPATKLQGGAFTIGKVLGQGGFGITYLGSDARLQRLVAIKEFFPQGCVRQHVTVHPTGAVTSAGYAAAKSKFLDEARVLAQFQHPGIVHIYGFFEENNSAYVVMEYLKGKTLAALVQERGPLPEWEALSYAEKIGAALAVVHGAGLLHRDIKPDNVIVTDDGRVVLVDFGTAREFAAAKTRHMTAMLTPGYAPLEQYGQHARFGPFTDTYALGATLYHLLTGQLPPPATDRAAGVDLAPPQRVNRNISPHVGDAIVWAMQVRADKRPQQVADFLRALSSPRAPAPAPGVTPPSQPAPEFGPHAIPKPNPQSAPPYQPGAGTPRPGMFQVQVSARTLNWPQRCACCSGAADSSFAASYTRTTGKRVIRNDTRGWQVPYCSTCLHHVRLKQEADNLAGLGCGAIVLAIAVAVGLSMVISTAGLVIGVILGVVLGAWVQQLRQQKTGEAKAAMTPVCCSVDPAVVYHGWYGSVHSFTFTNGEYADLFRGANAKKLIQ